MKTDRPVGPMRIVAGAYRGRTLIAPPGLATRPTSDRARQAVFNLLEHAAWSPGLQGARVIDVFAGSGALGLEALSRGAAFCLFVETDAAARGRDPRRISRPWRQTARCSAAAAFIAATPPTWARKPAGDGAPFDLAFLDPPYARGSASAPWRRWPRAAGSSAGAICVFERGADEPDPAPPASRRWTTRRYGAARVHVLKYSPGAA